MGWAATLQSVCYANSGKGEELYLLVAAIVGTSLQIAI